MRICSYVLVVDNGFCPNPFWGYCTLSACTPNHMGIKLEKGDWILGFSTTTRGSKLIYAMEISEILSLDAYFHDPRFKRKKPNLSGNWKECCGDNIYSLDKYGTYIQHPTKFHCESGFLEKDTKNPFVFISMNFYYFGGHAIDIPVEFETLTWKRQGCKCNHPQWIQDKFVNWLKNHYKPGIHGDPIDNKSQKYSCQ